MSSHEVASMAGASPMPPRIVVRDITSDERAVDPLEFLTNTTARAQPRFFWAAPAGDEVVVGYGVAAELQAQGAGRFGSLARAAEGLVDETTSPGPIRPRMFVSFGFDDADPESAVWQGFSAGWLVLPEATLTVARGRETLAAVDSVNVGDAAGAYIGAATGASGHADEALPPSGIDDLIAGALDRGTGRVLSNRIGRALDAIEAGMVDKVVVSTSCTVELSRVPDHVALLRSLRQQQPGCFHFYLSPSPGVAFLGASPERLVRLEGTELQTVALAGSARRDDDPVVDQALAEELVASAKERREHALVVEAIQSELDGYAPVVDPEPGLRRLATIQHLETNIRAEIPAGTSLLRLAGRLHPTPALGGTPRDRAGQLIGELEEDGRGMYGGAVGWIDSAGDGDLCVAIRSMLVRGRSVTAFAGAGIVLGSDPDEEVREMRRKLEASLGALAG